MRDAKAADAKQIMITIYEPTCEQNCHEHDLKEQAPPFDEEIYGNMTGV